MTQENTFLQIVYSQIVFSFVFEGTRKKKIKLFWFVWIYPSSLLLLLLPLHPLHCGIFYIQSASHDFWCLEKKEF